MFVNYYPNKPMQKKARRNFIEFGIVVLLFLTLYLTGTHTVVIGFMQSGLLHTGLLNPHLEVEDDTANTTAVQADFGASLINGNGEIVSLEQWRGKVIFLNLWATWCPPCIAEMPGINRLYNRVKGDDIVFLMISLDQDFEKAKSFHQKKDFDFNIYTINGSLPTVYTTQSIPATFVIDTAGRLAYSHEGMAAYDTKTFRQFLLSLK